MQGETILQTLKNKIFPSGVAILVMREKLSMARVDHKR
jgi:hypothetical protein